MFTSNLLFLWTITLKWILTSKQCFALEVLYGENLVNNTEICGSNGDMECEVLVTDIDEHMHWTIAPNVTAIIHIGRGQFKGGFIDATHATSLKFNCLGREACSKSSDEENYAILVPPKKGNFEFECKGMNACREMVIDDTLREAGNVNVLCTERACLQFDYQASPGYNHAGNFNMKCGYYSCESMNIACFFTNCDINFFERESASDTKVDTTYAQRAIISLADNALSSDFGEFALDVRCPLSSNCVNPCTIMLEHFGIDSDMFDYDGDYGFAYGFLPWPYLVFSKDSVHTPSIPQFYCKDPMAAVGSVFVLPDGNLGEIVNGTAAMNNGGDVPFQCTFMSEFLSLPSCPVEQTQSSTASPSTSEPTAMVTPQPTTSFPSLSPTEQSNAPSESPTSLCCLPLETETRTNFDNSITETITERDDECEVTKEIVTTTKDAVRVVTNTTFNQDGTRDVIRKHFDENDLKSMERYHEDVNGRRTFEVAETDTPTVGLTASPTQTLRPSESTKTAEPSSKITGQPSSSAEPSLSPTQQTDSPTKSPSSICCVSVVNVTKHHQDGSRTQIITERNDDCEMTKEMVTTTTRNGSLVTNTTFNPDGSRDVIRERYEENDLKSVERFHEDLNGVRTFEVEETNIPTAIFTAIPTQTLIPSESIRTAEPSSKITNQPSSAQPSLSPSQQTDLPTQSPTSLCCLSIVTEMKYHDDRSSTETVTKRDDDCKITTQIVTTKQENERPIKITNTTFNSDGTRDVIRKEYDGTDLQSEERYHEDVHGVRTFDVQPSRALTEPPSQPVTDAPSQRVTDAPSQRVTDAPSQRVTDAPSQPVTDAPSQLVTDAPSHSLIRLPLTKSPSNPLIMTKSPSQSKTEHPSHPLTEPPSNVLTESPVQSMMCCLPMTNVTMYDRDGTNTEIVTERDEDCDIRMQFVVTMRWTGALIKHSKFTFHQNKTKDIVITYYDLSAQSTARRLISQRESKTVTTFHENIHGERELIDEMTFNADGSTTKTVRETDDEGNITKETVTTRDWSDNLVEKMVTVFGTDGTKTSTEMTSVENGETTTTLMEMDGCSITKESETMKNAIGTLLREIETVYGHDGSSNTTANVFDDADGSATMRTTEMDRNGQVIKERITKHDHHGALIEKSDMILWKNKIKMKAVQSFHHNGTSTVRVFEEDEDGEWSLKIQVKRDLNGKPISENQEADDEQDHGINDEVEKEQIPQTKGMKTKDTKSISKWQDNAFSILLIIAGVAITAVVILGLIYLSYRSQILQRFQRCFIGARNPSPEQNDAVSSSATTSTTTSIIDSISDSASALSNAMSSEQLLNDSTESADSLV